MVEHITTRLKNWTKRLLAWLRAAEGWLATLDCDRLAYAGLALSYGAACLGVDKDLVSQSTTAFYMVLFVRG